MPKKAPPATVDDIDSLRNELKSVIADAEKKCLDAANAGLAGMQPKIDEMLPKCTAISEQGDTKTQDAAQAFTEAHVKKALEDLDGKIKRDYVPKLEGQIQGIDSRLSPVEERVMKALHDALPPLEKRFEEQLAALRADHEKKLQAMADEAQEERNALGQKIAEEARNAAERLEATRVPLAQNLSTLEERAFAKDAEQDVAADKTKKELQRQIVDLQQRVQQNKENIDESLGSTSTKLNQQLEELQNDTLKKFAEVDDYAQTLRKTLSENENLPTRRVEWTIAKVGERLRPWDTAKASLHTSWFSPRFDAAGMHDLQLEIQLYRPTDLQVEGQEAGDTSIFLWACKGVTVTYRLYIGTKTATYEKVFNGRVPYGAKRLCFIADEIEKDEDILRVGVEFLEVIRDIERPLGTAPGDSEEPLEGSLFFHRNINNRLLEQVRGQCEVMRSRMVRRVEWRVNHASVLRRVFPPNVPICSPTFVMAGIESMQLVFYPSGYTGSTDGFCSIFVFAPAGSTLNGLLCAGKYKHKVNHTFEMAGAFGRTNYGRYETVVEPDDTVLLALEIMEAYQDMRAVAHHAPQAGDVRDKSGGADDIPLGPGGVESVIKLQRNASRHNGLEEVQQLPSLWTSKPLGDIATALPDGFHGFSEIREKDNELAARGRKDPPPRGRPPRSESTPDLNQGHGDYVPKPAETPLQPPLPQMGAYAGQRVKMSPKTRLSPLARTQ